MVMTKNATKVWPVLTLTNLLRQLLKAWFKMYATNALGYLNNLCVKLVLDDGNNYLIAIRKKRYEAYEDGKWSGVTSSSLD